MEQEVVISLAFEKLRFIKCVFVKINEGRYCGFVIKFFLLFQNINIVYNFLNCSFLILKFLYIDFIKFC